MYSLTPYTSFSLNEHRAGPRGGPSLLAGTFDIRLWAERLINVAEGLATRGQCRGEGLGRRGGNMVNPGRGFMVLLTP